MTLTKTHRGRDLKVHTITSNDLATLKSDLQSWLSGLSEETVVSIDFETAASSDNRVYILYTE